MCWARRVRPRPHSRGGAKRVGPCGRLGASIGEGICCRCAPCYDERGEGDREAAAVEVSTMAEEPAAVSEMTILESAAVDAAAASDNPVMSEAHFSAAVAQGLDEHVFILDGSAFARASSCVYDGFERAVMGIGIELRLPQPPPAQRVTGAATTYLAAARRSHRFLGAGAGRRHPPLRQYTAAFRLVTLPLSVSPLLQLLAAVGGSTGCIGRSCLCNGHWQLSGVCNRHTEN
jgi:hypothetical protein